MGGKKLILKTVGTSAAYLACVALLNRDPVNQFQLLALDSAVLSISQLLLRERYQKERKFHFENLWLLGALIKYDKNKGSQLLQTLRVYLECEVSRLVDKLTLTAKMRA
ncbi:hypothetical protein [Aneurinibacillus terranovensis]|uniref:hypothetical protein n=1 Tax=Aneurinibacillus terranovensis TaxID=278991 RepID=UPI000489C5BD|nr:hypothetical protein [Aneurinibacillus terranovensis]